MCGIAGFVTARADIGEPELRAQVGRMAAALRHRGPDDEGVWIDPLAGIALGHRRLSVLDVSSQGHQPMASQCGRFVICYNGEIYNWQAIRSELEHVDSTVQWRGHSDTEVMLAAVARWGVEQSLKRFVGMFVFALWDRQERVLYLARDRLGEKPLYYGWVGDVLLFGSELKALRAHPAWQGAIDRDALALYMRYSYVPAPYSIYKGIRKLAPGTIARIASPRTQDSLVLRQYWSARQAAEQGVAWPFAGSDAEAVEQLDGLLRSTIRRQMVADVPLGAFLSGGIDSTTVVALMQAQSTRPIQTFTIGFNEADYDEARHAKAVAAHLGTEHTELYLTAAQAMAVIPKLPTLYDEPFSDSSQIPTFLVSELARRTVTVSLSGDGGDELFAGYNRYFWGTSIWRKTGWLPRPLRRAIAGSIEAVSPEKWNTWLSRVRAALPRHMDYPNPGDKLHKLADIIDAATICEMYDGLVSHWRNTRELVPGSTEPITVLRDKTQWANLENFASQMMYLDLVTYLPDDILVKLDRASMGVSLESRVPFLDHNVVEFAWRMPMTMKIRDGQGKWLLRQVAYKYVPRELFERPKTGFGIPIESWLRGPLRDWAEDLLDPVRIRNQGYLNPDPIMTKWKEHISGRRNWQYYLWDVLMFQAWKEQWF